MTGDGNTDTRPGTDRPITRADLESRLPRYIARVADFDDTGVAVAAGTPGGWQAVEWDLLGPFGIDAPGAWTEAAAAGARGGDGVKVAPSRRSTATPVRRSSRIGWR